MPGFVYGGLLASIADCHAMATATAAELARLGEASNAPAPRYVTAAIRIEYLKPTPQNVELEIRGRVIEQSERKKVIAVTIAAAGTVTMRAEAVAVRIPKSMMQPRSH
jgi:acyl-coenzyme A thioesterase PaaI-like protein